MKISLTAVIRWLLTIGLLFFVWRDAPWSVSVMLTLVAVRCEFQED